MNLTGRSPCSMQRIQKDIEQNSFAPVYLLCGDERYLKRQYTERLRTALSNIAGEMNTHLYSDKNISVETIIDLAETMPFLSERRAIFISDSGLFQSGGEKLAEYLSNPCESTCFVFTESEIDKRSKLYKAVNANGHIAEFVTPDERTLKIWIAGILSKEGMKITENTINHFLEFTGTDMENIQMELEKLISFCMGREVVTAEDVDTICSRRTSDRIFDMINAIAAGNTKEAMELYYDLLSLKIAPMRILFLIAKQCNQLLIVKEMRSQGHDQKTIAPQLGVPPFVAGKLIAQSGRFKTSTLRAALEQCVEAETAVKSGRMNDVMSVEVLLLSILKGHKN